jgi:transcriptional regulator with XRE-family HTH domain
MQAMDIRTIRKARSLSQADLAEMLGVTQSTVSRFETGELPIDARTALALEAIAARPADRQSAA